jgi:hypothetical protein
MCHIIERIKMLIKLESLTLPDNDRTINAFYYTTSWLGVKNLFTELVEQ